MTSIQRIRSYGIVVTLMATASAANRAAQAQRVCATVPELGSLVREIGGDEVSLTVFAKGTEDPHFVLPRPSFVKDLYRADLYVQLGLGMEVGWAPALLRNARNSKVTFGTAGFIDASSVIRPMQVPRGQVNRSQGDVHVFGNPHYLSDPINGLLVAGLIRDRLAEFAPARKSFYERRYRNFAARIGEALVGTDLARAYKQEDIPKLALLFERGRLASFLQSQQQASLLGGWLGAMQQHLGTKVVDDHNMWPYFARRFGLEVVDHLEPKPGIPPTTRHLAEVVQRMRAEKIGIVLASAYYDPRHAQFVARQTGAKILNMAHQVGARPGTGDYLSMVDYNVRQLASALGKAK